MANKEPVQNLLHPYCGIAVYVCAGSFLYIEKRIIRIIGSSVMDDNCKMVAKVKAITL